MGWLFFFYLILLISNLVFLIFLIVPLNITSYTHTFIPIPLYRYSLYPNQAAVLSNESLDLIITLIRYSHPAGHLQSQNIIHRNRILFLIISSVSGDVYDIIRIAHSYHLLESILQAKSTRLSEVPWLYPLF